MKFTYNRPDTVRWIAIIRIEHEGKIYDKVPDEPLKPGTVVYTLYSNQGARMGLRKEVIHEWNEQKSGERKSRPGYECIGNLLVGRDIMFTMR